LNVMLLVRRAGAWAGGRARAGRAAALGTMVLFGGVPVPPVWNWVNTPPVSESQRPGLSESDVFDAYASSLRYFGPRLSSSQAGEIAGLLIRSSNEFGLDARLVVAVLAEDGALARVRQGKEGISIGGRAASAAIRATAADLRRCMERRAKAGVVNERLMRAALAEHAARRRSRGGSPDRRAAAYARRVTRTYYQLCGYE
jgi:hypothetical protein